MNDITMKLNGDPLILQALREDITGEDISTNSVMPGFRMGQVELICKQDGIIAGLQVFKRVFELLDETTEVSFCCSDGDAVKKGQKLGLVRGDIRVLLSGERTALNFLQRMSGIATYTRAIADLLEGTGTKLLDTRKTTPNMRIFEKYAVKVGGGHNHRYNLSDGILLKDNHIGAAGGVGKAVAMAREYAPFVRKIEVEVENLEMLAEALEAGADIIMLDNMATDDMIKAVELCRGRTETECSGNVTRENVEKLVGIGVDYISCGALTHSAPILDLSMKICTPYKGDPMKVAERRKEIVNLLLSAPGPISGGELARKFGISRQIIVQDITVLKGTGYEILSTSQGYIMQRSPLAERVFKVRHTTAQTEDELSCIVELGGTVVNVFVWHKVYGKIEAPLNIFSPMHVKQFMEGVRAGQSTELMHVTGGYHYHTVRADNEETLDRIEAILRERGYIVPGA